MVLLLIPRGVPDLVLALLVITQDADAALRQFQGAAGFPSLGVATGTNRVSDHDERRIAVEVDVRPGERPQFLGPGTSEQRQDDLGAQAILAEQQRSTCTD